MKKAERLELKAQAAFELAGGASAPQTALKVGCAAETVRKWRREPEFVRAVEELQAIARDRSRTPQQMADALTEVLDRIKEVRRGPVVVSIPANASPRRRRRLMAEGIARVLFP
jgi:hypothetical protein